MPQQLYFPTHRVAETAPKGRILLNGNCQCVWDEEFNTFADYCCPSNVSGQPRFTRDSRSNAIDGADKWCNSYAACYCETDNSFCVLPKSFLVTFYVNSNACPDGGQDGVNFCGDCYDKELLKQI